ncbi:MAG: RusA family crossover junction endodeoxyribonuclease [Phycisphaerae bacterium]|nr:RusA family crossover junction endodeoxyribonuclease [Phycisphaerae bacterium]
MAAVAQTFQLPYPPSVNHYWRRVGRRTLISRAGRRYRQTVLTILALMRVTLMEGDVAVRMTVYPPDRRKRDLDNLTKAVFDALQYGGAYLDDSQIARFEVERARVVRGGKIIVEITERP